MPALYTAHAHVSGGRNGHGETSDGILKVDLRMPKEMGGAGGATNPEQLFALGYAACFESATRFVAGQKKLALKDMAISSDVGLLRGEAGFSLEVALHVEIVGLDLKTAEELVAAAHMVCPYSNATRGNIPVTIDVTVK